MAEAHTELNLLRSQLAALEQLLGVHETAVVEQAEHLENALREVRERADEADRLREQAEQAAARMQFLAEAGMTLAGSLEYETTLRSVAQLAVPGIADWCVIDLADAEGDVRRIAVAHEDPEKVRLVEELRTRYPDDPNAEFGAYSVMRSGEPQLVERIPPELLRKAARDDEHLRLIESLNLHSFIVVPLKARRRMLGALTLVSADPRRTYGKDDLELACDLAARAALAIDNARLVADLEATQHHLEQTATEVEAQSEELQSMVEELESTTQDLLESNAGLVEAKEEAERARRVAEEANSAKSQFLATMSHELRTPLNAIDGYAELMQLGIHGQLTDKQHAALGRIRTAQKRLLSLINDVLNFAKLEAGQIQITLDDISVYSLLANVESLVAPQAASRGLDLVIEQVDPGIFVRADQEKAEQILLNLVSNALKFTEPGGAIRINAQAGEDRTQIAVSDTGHGIAAHQVEAIFEPFVQAQNGMVREHGGVGLGLAISRDLARSMDGELHCVSELGAGSTFTLTLPAAMPVHSTAEAMRAVTSAAAVTDPDHRVDA
jgi:signal transduction histidine kinase